MGRLNKGDKVWFANKKKPYKVRACNERFAICTQPYNFKPHTVIYTIVDFKRNVRGMDNYVFGIYDYYSDEDCELLKRGDLGLVLWKGLGNITM